MPLIVLISLQGEVAHTFNPRMKETERHLDLKASLLYIMSSRAVSYIVTPCLPALPKKVILFLFRQDLNM